MHYVVGSMSMTHAKHMQIHCECHFHTIYHIPYSIYHIPKCSHWPKHHEYFYENSPSRPNIYIRWGVSIVLGSFWSAHDSGTIKSCIRIGKFWFLGIKKNNKKNSPVYNQFFPILKWIQENQMVWLHLFDSYDWICFIHLLDLFDCNQTVAHCYKRIFEKTCEDIQWLMREEFLMPLGFEKIWPLPRS